MEISELELLARNFLKETYQMELTIPIIRNNRLRTSLGRFVVSHDQKPLRIELSGKVLTYGTRATIRGVLFHECIHYAFFVQGKNFTDGDPEFEAELLKHRAPRTETLKVGKHYIFSCSNCGQKGETIVKRVVKERKNYRSTCCRAKIVLEGVKIYDGSKE